MKRLKFRIRVPFICLVMLVASMADDALAAEYDPNVDLVAEVVHHPGYHSALKPGSRIVHPTRASLAYAAGLLDAGDPNMVGRAARVIRKVISLQDQDPNSHTYGIWSWYYEEPLDQMRPPDWNWADFLGMTLCHIALRQLDKLPADLQRDVLESLRHAARSIERRNVTVAYTNIIAKGTYVTFAASEILKLADLHAYARDRLDRFLAFVEDQGSFTEYNSPTYNRVTLEALDAFVRDVKDAEAKPKIARIQWLLWRHIGSHYHAPTGQWAGPHSRCYRDLLGREAWIDAACRAAAGEQTDTTCPADLLSLFGPLRDARQVKERFLHRGLVPPGPGFYTILGTTYLHPAFALGSTNRNDLWNQRRPLIAYWGTARAPAYLRLRCLHDGYDFASGQLLAVQEKGCILAAATFATDYGDTHPSLDRVKDATIRAADLRFRFEFGGAAKDIVLPSGVPVGRTLIASHSTVRIGLRVLQADFGEYPIRIESGRDDGIAFVDVVLYSGPKRSVDLAQTSPALVAFALALAPADAALGADQFASAEARVEGDTAMLTWDAPSARLRLQAPAQPGHRRPVQEAALGYINGEPDWE